MCIAVLALTGLLAGHVPAEALAAVVPALLVALALWEQFVAGR